MLVGGGGLLCVLSNRPASRSDIVGSCDMRGGSGSAICMDLTDINAKVEIICSQYTLSRSKPCDLSGAIGGCASPRTITWYYPSSDTTSAADVQKKCYGDEFRTPSNP